MDGPASTAVDDACRTIKRVLDLDRRGGTLVRRDHETVMLVDYDCVSQRAIDAICTQHPHIHVYVVKCESSSSGYMLTFSYVYTASWFASSSFAELCFCLILLVMSVSVTHGTPVFS